MQMSCHSFKYARKMQLPCYWCKNFDKCAYCFIQIVVSILNQIINKYILLIIVQPIVLTLEDTGCGHALNFSLMLFQVISYYWVSSTDIPLQEYLLPLLFDLSPKMKCHETKSNFSLMVRCSLFNETRVIRSTLRSELFKKNVFHRQTLNPVSCSNLRGFV